MSRTRCASASAAAWMAIAAFLAAGASAKTITLHFFSKQVYSRISDAAGKPLSGSSAPAVGDRISFASNDYRGDHRHHARRASASDHLTCTVLSGTRALCDGAIAIGGSMILADDFTFDFSAKTNLAKVTGGTGRYHHAHGTVVATTAGANSDVTITIGF